MFNHTAVFYLKEVHILSKYAMAGQFSLIEPIYIRDRDCTIATPIMRGKQDTPIYGQGVRITPRIPSKRETAHDKEVYLPALLPLEEYDLIVVMISGGKDSIACYLKLLELGVPKDKIEFWHHDVDGGHPTRSMDWRCTQNYMKAFAEAEGIPLRVSWRKNGFFGELYRVGASEPVEWVEPGTGEIMECKLSPNYVRCQEIKLRNKGNVEEQLKPYGCRMKFPAKNGDLTTRWCSAYLKIMVASSIMSNIEKTKANAKVLVVSGERRGESVGRSKYNEMEIHRTNASHRLARLVHQWRPVIDYSEKDVWELLKRHKVNPHPCYRAGWNRCSCAQCIFSTPSHFAGIREVYPDEYEKLKQDEIILGFTLDNKCDLDTFVGDAKSCVYHGDAAAMRSLITGEFGVDDVYVDEWHYPAGAFHGAEGGPC